MRLTIKLVACDRCPDVIREDDAAWKGWWTDPADHRDLCPVCYLRTQQELRTAEVEAL